MPLFDSLEREVSSFFVAQGSIFDTILKTLLDRVTQIETRVDSNILTIQKLVHSGGAGAGGAGGGGGGGGGSNEEIEYFVMTLARQLNVVLALLFQPCAQDAVAQTHARQQQMPSISHVLTDNESILMGLAAANLLQADEQQQENVSSAVEEADTSTDTVRLKVMDPVVEDIEVTLSDAVHEVEAASAAVALPVVAAVVVQPAAPPSRRGQRKSTFTMVHHLQFAEDQRRREEQGLLQRMKRLLSDSQALCQSQCRSLHGQNDSLLRELQLQNEKLRSEWAYQQQQQASVELSQAQFHEQQQKEMEKQLLAFSNAFLASQTRQEQQIARILENLRDCGDRFLCKSDLEHVAATWLQTARDDCIYGANAETLTQLQQDLGELQKMLSGEAVSPALSRLMDEITKVQELLERLLAMLELDPDALHGANGVSLMQRLRELMGQLDELAHNALADAQMSNHSAVFLTDFTRQMELGTASLLEAMERQQETYQQALSQQQGELELLRLDLQTQKRSEDELRRQLAACPNQEDTMRLVNALKDQIQASTSDSASRMLGTVDDLRSKMADLPTLGFLDELLHNKADRSEIDRLRLLLASNVPSGPGGPSLSKSPTRCLSCDQSLPFMQSRPGSASHQSINQSERPTSATSNPVHSSSSRPSSANATGYARPLSRGSSPMRNSVGPNHHFHQSMVSLPTPHDDRNTESDQQGPNRYVSPFTRAMLMVSEGGSLSTHDILRDLAATIEATKRRRQRMQDQQEQLAGLAEERLVLSFASGPSSPSKRTSLALAETSDERKNRIPLRRTTLSDQVVYGPSITSGFLKPKRSIAASGFGSMAKAGPDSARHDSDESNTFRPKTAVVAERRTTTAGGNVIMRAPSTTVVIRPFSEVPHQDNNGGAKRTSRGK